MKFCLFLLILILSCGFVSAFPITIEFSKDSFFSGETVQANIYVEDLDYGLDSNMLTFFNNISNFPINPSLIQLGQDHYYLYFDLDEDLISGNYSLVFNDVIYRIDNVLTQDDFVFDMIIQETNDSILSINPGIIKVGDVQVNNNFNIYLLNRGNENILVSLTSSSSFIDLSLNEVSLGAGQSNLINVYLSEYLIDNIETENIEISYDNKSYTLPLWFRRDDTTFTDIELVEGDLYFAEDVEFFNKSIYFNESIIGGYVKVRNSFNLSLYDINFDLDDSLKEVIDLEFSSLDEIGGNEVIKLYLNINENKDIEHGTYEGYVYLENGELEDSFLMIINVLSIIEEEEIIDDIISDDIEDIEPEEQKKLVLGVWFWALIFLVFVGLILYLIYNKKKPKKTNFPFKNR